MIRVVLDTNIFISALLKRNGICGLIIQAWHNQEFTLLYSTELILELKDVVQYIRLKPRLRRAEIGALIRQIWLQGSRVFENRNTTNSTDPKDDFLIAIAQNGEADYLISRDIQGILELPLQNIQVLTPESFLQILKKEQL